MSIYIRYIYHKYSHTPTTLRIESYRVPIFHTHTLYPYPTLIYLSSTEYTLHLTQTIYMCIPRNHLVTPAFYPYISPATYTPVHICIHQAPTCISIQYLNLPINRLITISLDNR